MESRDARLAVREKAPLGGHAIGGLSDAVVGVGAGDREQAAAWASSVFAPAAGADRTGRINDVPDVRLGMDSGAAMLDAALPPAAEAAAIRHCESTDRWDAVSPDGMNIGGYQINLIHGWTREQLLDPVGNTLAMIALWRDGGWSAWACAYAAEEGR